MSMSHTRSARAPFRPRAYRLAYQRGNCSSCFIDRDATSKRGGKEMKRGDERRGEGEV